MASLTPRSPGWVALLSSVVTIAAVSGFLLLWLWPLGQFGAWSLHWPYLRDGLLSLLPVGDAGAEWTLYQDNLARQGVLHELYARLILWGASALGSGVFVYGTMRQPALEADTHVRGLQYLADPRQATRRARQHAEREARRDTTWGVSVHPAVRLTAGRENLGILAVGAQGSGKTQFLLPMLQQVCSAIQADDADRSYRAVIFDFKGEYTEVLPVEDDAFTLIAPWDRRSAHWAIAQDVRTRGDARLIAEQMISDSKDPMWSNASRQVLTGLIHALALTKPGQWDFPDLAELLGAGGSALSAALTVGNREAVRLVSNPEENKTAQSILANLAAFMAPITDLAEAWRSEPPINTPRRHDREEADTPRTPFSLQRWLAEDWQGPRILVLQGSSRYEPLMHAFLRSFLGVLIARVIDPGFTEARSRDTDYRLYVFLDEFIRLGRLPDIEKLITVGRSKGVRLLLGLQDIAQVRAVYGPDLAAAWFSQLATQFYGRVAPGDTATWLASVFARREVEHTVYTASRQSQGGYSETVGWRPLEAPVLLPGQLASDLGASPDGVDGLLHCTGWGHLYRLHWPITRLPKRRDAADPAPWTQPNPPAAHALPQRAADPPDTPAAPPQLHAAGTPKAPPRSTPPAASASRPTSALPGVDAEPLLTALRDIVHPGRLHGSPKERGLLGWQVRHDVLLIGRAIAQRLRNHALVKDALVALKDNAALYDLLLAKGITQPSPANGKPVCKACFDDVREAVIRIPLRTLWPDLSLRPPPFTGEFHWDTTVTMAEPESTEPQD
jgi:hypothetical protein